MIRVLIVVSSALLAICGPALAAERGEVAVSVRAADGLVLHGSWYDSGRRTGRAVLLLHEMTGNRRAWAPFLDGLAAAGIDVLAVDLRGFGETGGKMDLDAQLADAGAWLAWLRARPGVNPEHVGVMGESLGARLAVIACARDQRCRAAAALSPYGLYETADLDFRDRAVFLMGTRGDDVHSALAVRKMAADVQGDATIRLVAGSEPGIATLLEGRLIPEPVAWLDRNL